MTFRPLVAVEVGEQIIAAGAGEQCPYTRVVVQRRDDSGIVCAPYLT
jgi:hypothetical protein